jgi:outer membrane protein TolC
VSVFARAVSALILVTALAAAQQATVPVPGEPPSAEQQPVNPPPGAGGKTPPGSAGQTPGAAGPGEPSSPGSAANAAAPVAIDLTSALQRARDYNQQFMAAQFAAQSAREDRIQAKAALYPTLNWLNQYIYTQGNGTPSGVFVANDGVHIYNEQAAVHAELFSLTKRADYRRAAAAEATARARLEVARRGLTAVVVQSYYGLAAAQQHLTNARQSLAEAERFLDITQKQETGGEVAHADVIKAQLQVQQRERDLADAQIAVERARLALGVVVFPDPLQQYSIGSELSPSAPLPSLEEIRSQAVANSPEVRAAQAASRQAHFGVASARGAYYPSLVLDYWYGIDANVFNIRGPEDRQNLGSVVQGTVTVPVWNWGATRSRVRQAELQEKQAQTELTLAQRQLVADINGFYLEALAAKNQLDSLRASADLSAESLRLTLLRYQAGEATALEVSDAQSTLAQARNAYSDGVTRFAVALANLQTLTGKL